MGAARRLRRGLGREIVESEQRFAILDQAGGGFVVFAAVFLEASVEGLLGNLARLGLVDGVEILLGLAWHGRRHLVEYVGGLVHP